MKRIVITGGAGFIGSHTADLLLQQGFKVVVMDSLITGKLTNLKAFHAGLEFLQEDVLNYPKLVSVIKNCDAVLHLAALPSVPKSIEDPVESLKINTLGFLHVLQAIREVGRSVRLVYASSAAVYGANQSMPCRDDAPLMSEVLSPYALDKTNNERYAALYAKLFNINSLGLRYFNAYGARQDPKSAYSGVISRFMANYRRGTPLTIFGDGKQSRDFIHVSDVARANLLAIQSDYAGVLNIATGVPETLNQLVHYIETAGGEPAVVNREPARAGDIVNSYANIAQAERYLKFRYAVDLASGVSQMVKDKVE